MCVKGMKLSDRYLLGPQFFVDSTADVSFLYPVWRDSESFQVIRKFFSSTFEGAVEKIYEAVPIPDREKRTLALPEGYQGRFDTGRGRERSGRNAKRINELMAERFGEGARLIITESSAPVRPPDKPNRYQEEEERRREAMEDPVVQAVQDKLGGEIEDIKLK